MRGESGLSSRLEMSKLMTNSRTSFILTNAQRHVIQSNVFKPITRSFGHLSSRGTFIIYLVVIFCSNAFSHNITLDTTKYSFGFFFQF